MRTNRAISLVLLAGLSLSLTVQIINFHSIQNKEYLRKIKEEYLQNNSTSYNVKRFEESFDMDDIRTLVPLIE